MDVLTQAYSHVLEDMEKEAADKLNNAFSEDESS